MSRTQQTLLTKQSRSSGFVHAPKRAFSTTDDKDAEVKATEEKTDKEVAPEETQSAPVEEPVATEAASKTATKPAKKKS